MDSINNLLIISHVVHYTYEGKLFAYGPYVREIELWADLFPLVVIACPLRSEPAPSDCILFEHGNISILPQLERGGENWEAKVIQVISLPQMIFSLFRVMRQADAIHVRCPGNLGLLGVLLAPFFSSYRIAKYAGQWNGYPGEALTYRLQRWLLKSRWWNAPVTVYGNWENQPQHVVPFFTSLLTDEQLLIAQKSALGKSLHNPMRIIYVGRLSCAKNVHILIDAIHRLAIQGVTCECKIIGEGVELQKLIQLSQNLCVSDRVQFMGGMPFEDVISYYQWADVLILVSETEGWPKAIVEGMAFGLVCVGSNRGLVPQILGKGRGLVVEPGDVNQLVDAFLRIRSGWEYAVMSQESAKWSQQYSKKNLQSAIRDLMIKSWKLTDDALLFVDKEVRRDVSANPPLN